MIFRKIYPAFKEFVDRSFAVALLVVLAPLLLGVWFAVRLTSKGPGIFWSERVGRNGDVFLMPKFRTMTVCSKIMPREHATVQDFKMTPIGSFLRRTSLDEFPQFLSIAIGHMSFIGPRPLLQGDEGELARRCYAEISRLRPGLTGLAQVKGRNGVLPRSKARYDAFYAREFCLLLDTKIILSTLKILHRSDMIR